MWNKIKTWALTETKSNRLEDLITIFLSLSILTSIIIGVING